MRFVKASERWPEDDKKIYFVKFRYDKNGEWYNGIASFGSYCLLRDGRGSLSRFTDDIEYLDESLPASIEQEVDRLYPYEKDRTPFSRHNLDAALQRSAHITCARQYMGEIERLRAKIVSLEEELALYRIEK